MTSSYEAQPVKIQSIFPPYDQEPALRRRRLVCIDDLLGPPPDIDMKPPLLCKVLESFIRPEASPSHSRLGRKIGVPVEVQVREGLCGAVAQQYQITAGGETDKSCYP